MKHSAVCQRYVNRASRTMLSIFSQKGPDDAYAMVLIPKRRSGILGFTSIPTMGKCICEVGGRYKDEQKTGLVWRPNPLWRIAYVVCEQDITYDLPIERAATKDDVMVNFDFMVSFKVKNAENFIYKIGANKFDLLLRGAIQEAIRHLARQYTHQTILDLHGTSCGDFLTELSEQFKPYGVVFNAAKITDVILPEGIARDLSAFTTITKDIDTAVRSFEHAIMKLENDQIRRQTEIKLECDRQCSEMVARKSAAEINMREHLIKAEEERSVAITLAEQQAATAIREAGAKLISAKLEEERKCQDSIGRAKANYAEAEAEYERYVNTANTRAAAIRQAAEAEAMAVRALGSAEKKFSAQLSSTREFAAGMARLRATTELAKIGDMTIAGDAAESIIGEMMAMSQAGKPVSAATASAGAR